MYLCASCKSNKLLRKGVVFDLFKGQFTTYFTIIKIIGLQPGFYETINWASLEVVIVWLRSTSDGVYRYSSLLSSWAVDNYMYLYRSMFIIHIRHDGITLFIGGAERLQLCRIYVP